VSHQLAGFAGFLAVVAVVTPHLGSIVSPAAHAETAVRMERTGDMPASPPVIIAAPRPLAAAPVAPAPAYSISVTSDLVAYGDTKTSDFDPEHPPTDMGEPG
jgi:hypothetical protein